MSKPIDVDAVLSEAAWDEDLLMWETERQLLISPELPRLWEAASKAADEARARTDAAMKGAGNG